MKASTELKQNDELIWKTYLKLVGKSNPKLELARAVEIFKRELPESDSHPQCLSPAQYRLLSQWFSLAAKVDCRLFEKWQTDYDLTHVSLMYASQYLSNPASVFGHTFLLLGSGKSEKFTQMTLNYTAEIPPEESVFNYAIKGIGGGFKGYFSLMPYYHRLHVYSDMENRDLWEYRLNLDSVELELIMSVIWELNQQVALDYYFLNENCASVLLWLLKVVRPSIDISISHPLYLAPSEIPKILSRESLVAAIQFYPSLMQKLEFKFNKMSSRQLSDYQQLLKNGMRPGPNDDALVFEAVIDHISLLRYRLGDKLSLSMQVLERETLLRRAKIVATLPTEFSESANPPAPHLSHRPMQWKWGYVRTHGRDAVSINYRLAIHGLLDREAGFLKNSSIEVFDIETRYSREDQWSLDSINLFSMTNHPPLGRMTFPLSWSYQFLVERNRFQGNQNSLQALASARVGGTMNVGAPQLAGYVMAGITARTGSVRPQGHAETGPIAGFLFSQGQLKFKSEVSLQVQALENEVPQLLMAVQELRLELTERVALYGGYEASSDLAKRVSYEEMQIRLGWDF